MSVPFWQRHGTFAEAIPRSVKVVTQIRVRSVASGVGGTVREETLQLQGEIQCSLAEDVEARRSERPERHRPDRARVAAREHESETCAVRGADKIHSSISEGRDDVVEIVGGGVGRVLRQIGGLPQLGDASSCCLRRLGIVGDLKSVRAIQEVRLTCAALIYEDEIPLLADLGQFGEHRRPNERAALSGTAAEYEDGIGGASRRRSGNDDRVDGDLASRCLS